MAEDRRVRKTRNAIKNAFIQLLKEKDLDKITISDISNAADINRGTFYLHYEDKYILLTSMENEYVEELHSMTRISKLLESVKNIDEFLEVYTNHFLKNVMEHVQANLEFYQVVLNLDRRSQLEERLKENILENMSARMDDKGEIAGIPLSYFHSYVCGSMLALFKQWVQDEQRVDVDTLITYIAKLSFNGPLRLIASDNI
ncbi:TetR/AcrR family transcriptional regulator [Staphylococcus simulans]|uniref:TetR/AcrR family transcriptional regulator n=1 Tax=Staphylococcus simulans TaxID=1286 RepID=UPI000D032127|nr:TetR/AcrR family transcriptional regulator [Staphylococcus simulans]